VLVPPFVSHMEHYPAAEPDRVLATVLFTDIVASTEHTIEVDDSGENPQWDISAGLLRQLMGRQNRHWRWWSWDRRRVRRPTEAVGVDCVPVHDRRRHAHDACRSSDPGGRLGGAARGPGGRAADSRRGQKLVSVHSTPEGRSVPPLVIVSWAASLPGTNRAR
jgi:hypothetical protein